MESGKWEVGSGNWKSIEAANWWWLLLSPYPHTFVEDDRHRPWFRTLTRDYRWSRMTNNHPSSLPEYSSVGDVIYLQCSSGRGYYSSARWQVMASSEKARILRRYCSCGLMRLINLNVLCLEWMNEYSNDLQCYSPAVLVVMTVGGRKALQTTCIADPLTMVSRRH